MRFDFGALPGQQASRPVVPVSFPALPGLRVLALLDTGAMGNRFDAELAEEMGLDPSAGSVRRLVLGGSQHMAHVLDVELTVGRWTWTAPVAFAQGWAHRHGVLGLEGFFDRFAVRIEASASYCALTRRP